LYVVVMCDLGSRHSLRYSRNSQYFMETEGLFPCSQGPVTDPFLKPD
jgi:hypothetical protein